MIKKIIKKALTTISANRIVVDRFEKKSFSQSGEDLIVKFLFDAVGIAKPSYIDIGAHHPKYLNNTQIFYDLGSSGINIEPDPSLFKEFLIERKRDLNLNIGIGAASGIQDFYIINVPTLNTFSKEEALGYSSKGDFHIAEVKQLEVVTLSQILEKYCNNIFPDFLTLDAEGIDEIVLRNLDTIGSKPIVICVETLSFSQNGTGVKNKQLIAFLEERGYLLYADTNINSIFILKERWISQ